MVLARISFEPRKISRSQRQELEWQVDTYLSSLELNGQIVGQEWRTAWHQDVFTVYAELPRPDSLDPQYHSDWVRKFFEAFEAKLAGPPEWSILDDEIPRRFPSLKSASFLYLDAVDEWVPLHRGNDGGDIPLYLVPVDQCTRQNLSRWSTHANDCEALWMHSGALEMPAYRQLADPTSEHGQEGREFCQKIEEATGIPTYYYLKRFWGRKRGEGDRPCPLCGQPWRIAAKKTKNPRFWHFDFMCVPCRLVSHLASVDDDERHAKIGEYRVKAKAQGESGQPAPKENARIEKSR